MSARVFTPLLLSAIGGGLILAAACTEHVPDPIAPSSFDGGTGALPPLEATPPGTVPAADRRDESSSPVVFDALRGGVWTANGDTGSLSYANVDTHELVQEVPIGKDIRSVALSPDARWVAAVDRAGNAVALVDAESRVLKRTIALGGRPRAAVWDAWEPRWLFVSIEDDDTIAVVDRTTGTLARTVYVGRIPAGLAVSKDRHELLVGHRIDARMTLLALDGLGSPATVPAPLAEIPLAIEPPNDDPKVPQGAPYAFESFGWSADGANVWVPHQLITVRQPFQFQSTIFPAISVVDVVGRREVPNDPATAPDGFDGRKNLFGGLDVIDEGGNSSIVSQPCATRLHPGGLVAYALACGSEDLFTFDATTGKATDLLRDLPGDHPVGLALDDTGARAFLLSDQSQTLTVLDLAGGSPLGHARVVGAPIKLVPKDPVDPELREGLKLFFRANSRKGTLPVTGNNWMSCAACHLDGFGAENQVFFETLKAKSRAVDAQIGHVGLKDLFSTAATPTDKTFEPHDVLVAFTDQAGLAPDRLGLKRDGAVDPANPSPEARLLAARVARVIARDLPLGPSWFSFRGDKPNPDYDGAWCGTCHQAEYDAWKKSAHAHAGEDPMVLFGIGVEQKARGPQYSRLCAGCHDPVNARLGEVSFASTRKTTGITCLGCHDVTRTIRAGGNADLEATSHDWTQDHKAWGLRSLDLLRKPEFCGGCHQQFIPGAGITAITTTSEWQASAYATGKDRLACLDCHAPKAPGKTAGVDMNIADHSMVGGNVWLASHFGDPTFPDTVRRNLQSAIKIAVAKNAQGLVATVTNQTVGHSFPTGVADIREPWLEVQAVDAQKKVLARYGGPDANGLIPAAAARFGFDIARADGTILLQHELSETTKVPFERRIPAQGSLDVALPLPANLPQGTVGLDVVLFYRNVRTPYFRAALADPNETPPDIEMARTRVPQ